MDRSTSQCTIGSGCESGWTLYLDQSTTLHEDQHHQQFHGDYNRSLKLGFHQEEEEEEEDLSMVSDASSGPPFYHEDCDQDSFNGNGFHHFSPSTSDSVKKMKKKKGKSSKDQMLMHSHLDDTASSPVLSFSKRNINFSNKKPPMEHVSSQGFSATQFKGKSGVKKHFGFFKSEK